MRSAWADVCAASSYDEPAHLSQLYTPLDTLPLINGACADADSELQQEVLKFARVPIAIQERLHARPCVIFRQQATPNFEIIRFFELARRLGRPPLILEMPHDLFTPSLNPSKRNLGKLTIVLEGRAIRKIPVVTFGQMEKRPFSAVRCNDGTPFVEFHHGLVRTVLGERAMESLVDATEFFAVERPRQYYERLFALFTCFGILADCYLLSGWEEGFTESVVIPAYDATVDRFGIAPVIVRHLPIGTEPDPRWEHYPEAVLAAAIKVARKTIR